MREAFQTEGATVSRPTRVEGVGGLRTLRMCMPCYGLDVARRVGTLKRLEAVNDTAAGSCEQGYSGSNAESGVGNTKIRKHCSGL